VLFDYFAAGSEEEAAAVIDRVGGPGSNAYSPSAPPAPARGWLGRKRSAPQPPVTDPESVEFDTISVTSIDPVVQLGTLEELLSGKSYDDIADDPEGAMVLESRDDGERLVCSISQGLTAALANATREDLERVAEPWSQTEEFWGEGDPAQLLEFLRAMAVLVRRSQAKGQGLYCLVSV